MRESKALIRSMLAAKDFGSIEHLASSKTGVTRTLVSLLYDNDELIRFRAATALGAAASAEGSRKPERVRNLIRGLFWTMNDESGSICWHAPEAIAEILINLPALRGEFLPILLSFIDEEPFQRGVHRAACRLSRDDSSTMSAYSSRLTRSLSNQDPIIRGLAALALGTIGDASHVSALRSIESDKAAFAHFDTDLSEFVKLTVGQIASHAIARLDLIEPIKEEKIKGDA
jgi:hypothetical protein